MNLWIVNKVPKQVMKKGVRTLTLEELMKVYHYQGRPGSRDGIADIYIAKDFSIINDNNFKLIKKVFKKELA